MAKKKKSFLGTVIKLGGIAAAAAVAYSKRSEIKAFLADAAERIFPEDTELEPVEETLETEPDIVIDATGKAEVSEETQEDAPEA